MAESTIVEYSTEYTITNFCSLRALVFSRMCVARWLHWSNLISARYTGQISVDA